MGSGAQASAPAEPARRRARSGMFAGAFGRLLAPLDQFQLPSRAGLYAVAALFAATGAFGAVIGDRLGEIRQGVFAAADFATAKAGFGIESVVMTGLEEVRDSDVLRALEIGDSTSLLTFNAHWARERLSDIAWVKSATVQKLFPGTLRVDIVEREPYALWQLTGIVSLIDRDGEVIGEFGDERFASLPLVVGSGANKRVEDLMALVAPHPSVATRLRAAVRVADRRWNLMLDNGIEVRLPETDANAALDRLDDLTAKQGLMARDIVLVDLRLADRLVVRLSDQAATQRKDTVNSRGTAKKRKGQDT
jgi:cell division protein FtsQ